MFGTTSNMIFSELYGDSSATYDNLDVRIGEIKSDDNICHDCNIPLKIGNNAMICEMCGIEKEMELEQDTENQNKDNYNGGGNGVFGFSGNKNAYGYNRALLKISSDYSVISYQNIKKEIFNRINQYKGPKPPVSVQQLCIDYYFTIKENDQSYLTQINSDSKVKKKRLVFRGNGKWGMIAACLSKACAESGLTRTPNEIANIIQVDQKYVSAGEKRMQEFQEMGIISFEISDNLINDYVTRYFSLLSIPEKYMAFVLELIERAEKKHLLVNQNIKPSKKVSGAIYLLCQRVPELRHITKEVICKECCISDNYFTKYYNILYLNPIAMRKVFKKYHIPMWNEWRRIKYKSK